MSINTVHGCRHKCKLKLPCINNIQKCCHWALARFRWTETSGKVGYGLLSPHFILFLELIDIVSSGLKMKGTTHFVFSTESRSCDGLGFVSARGMSKLHICKSTLLKMLKSTCRLQQHVVPSKTMSFFQGHPCLFSASLSKLHSPPVQVLA